MLFLLTGDVRTGKTRWLERLVAELNTVSVRCHGVMTPGVWERRDSFSFEKLGIEAVLLPGGERIPFAQRRDLAEAAGVFREESQAAHAGLGWHISDAAIVQVNEHLAALPLPDGRAHPTLLVVDELGKLELLQGTGFTEAVHLLERGPVLGREHAVAVVRSALVDNAEERFAGAWGGCVRIHPDDEAMQTVLSALT